MTTPLYDLLSQRAADGPPGGSEILRQLLCEMHAPENLLGVQKVACQTAALLQLALSMLGEKDDCCEILRAYAVELKWLIVHVRNKASNLSGDPDIRERMLRDQGTNPLIGKCAMKHGLWCLLWYDHADPSLGPVFRILQLKALIAHMAVLRYWLPKADWKSENKKPRTTVLHGLYQETRALRKPAQPQQPNGYFRRSLSPFGVSLSCTQAVAR